VDVRLLRTDPDFVSRARGHGNEVTAWTVNEPEDIQFCEDLGISGFTTDHPDRVQEIAAFEVRQRDFSH
jgi:glycerophosphoryl diester phosphodiesterase